MSIYMTRDQKWARLTHSFIYMYDDGEYVCVLILQKKQLRFKLTKSSELRAPPAGHTSDTHERVCVCERERKSLIYNVHVTQNQCTSARIKLIYLVFRLSRL